MSSGTSTRIDSVDLFRGFTMFLLIGEFTGIYNLLWDSTNQGTLANSFIEQFHHHPWNGLRFWDLVQPFFMFLVGVSLPFAVKTRTRRGHTQAEITKHVWIRSIKLFLFGWSLYCIGPGEITFHFQNVLTQIAITYPIAYFIMHWSAARQILFSIGLLLITELAFRLFPVEGFDQAFVAGHNFGEWIEYKLDGKIPGGHWVSINAIPTAAHTIWGVLAGRILQLNPDKNKIVRYLIVSLLMIFVGYVMNGFIPIIKRIATSSFVVVSGGYCILFMFLFYYLIDLKKYRFSLKFFEVISINSLFIYLFAHLDGGEFLERIVHPFTYLFQTNNQSQTIPILTSLTVWMLMWYMCHWMYKKQIFIKI